MAKQLEKLRAMTTVVSDTGIFMRLKNINLPMQQQILL